MSRLAIPATIAAAPTASQPQLEAVQRQLGSVPNLFRLAATSPATLSGYLGLNAALAKGAFDAGLRERIAIAVAAANGCGYCLSAHTYLGLNVAKVDAAELAASARGESQDPKVRSALVFVRQVVAARGHVGAADLQAVRAAGWSDPEVLELVAHVAVNTLTNYLNEVAQTDLDFPRVDVPKAA